MKHFIILLSLIAFCCACQQTQNKEADETAIKAHFETFATAWNNQDAKAMGASHTEDGSLLDPLGTEARGQIAVEELLGKTVTTILKNSITSFTIEHIRFLKSDVVFVDATQNVTGAMSSEGTEMPAMKFHVAVTLIKKGGGWWFVDARPYQFMTPPPAPATESEK